MKLLFIQLSDIHFKLRGNSILEKENQIFVAIRNQTLEVEEIFLLLTGDSAFSGNRDEYLIAQNFVQKLVNLITEYSHKKVHCITIPGNHDCNFENDNQSRRNQITLIQKLGDSAIDESVIDQCCVVQNEYFVYQNLLVDKSSIAYSDKLLTIHQYNIGDKNIVFYCYNTSYISEIKEQPGRLIYPISFIHDLVFSTKADLFISLFHHPLNWFSPANKREFSTHIQNTCDFYFTGHEHNFSKTQLEDLDENTVYHIEGSVLQDSEDRFESEFSLVAFDLHAENFKIENYSWSTDKYQLTSEKNEWVNYKRGKLKLKNKYNINHKFGMVLEDVGGKFTHPNKSDVKLSDLYIYPKLRVFNQKENTDETISFVLEDSEGLLGSIKKGGKYLFFGGESVGKTSLLKTAHKIVYKKGFIPVFIDGSLIKNSAIDEFKKVVLRHFVEQYGEQDIQEFEREDINNVFLIIDDIDKNPLKEQKAKARLIRTLTSYYKNIIISANELYAIEEIVTDKASDGNLYSAFEQYEILEFNHSLRSKLIYRWYSLGQEGFLNDADILKKCDDAVRAVNIIMGNKIVPSYPFFLLILLQTIETTNPHATSISSYGNYYQLLILKAFTEKIKDQASLNMYESYCAELAHCFFKKKTRILSDAEFLIFHSDVTSYERLDFPKLTSERALDTLKNLGVLVTYGDTIEFKYQYTYYFFEARYLAQNIDKQEVREIISKLCKRVYRTEFANILMFVIHFSNNEFVVSELIDNARKIFSELLPCKLENDIGQIQKLVTEIPKLFLQNKSVEAIRDSENEKLDQDEEDEGSKHDGRSEPEELNSTWDLDESTTEIDVVSRLNLSFKLIEILGQVLKNNQGGMTGPVKYEMLRETYLMGLRTLNVFFSVLNDNTDFILNQLTDLLSKVHNAEKEKVEKTSRHLLFGLCSQISYIFIKKISDSVSTNWLSDKYPRIQEELNYPSVKIINFLIKLDVTNGFPERDLAAIKDEIERYPLSYYLLRRIVVNHLHRHHIDYKDKQRICNFLGIPLESQIRMDSERKKKEEV